LTTASTTDSNVVKIVSKKIDCELKIFTWASATTSTIEWYSSKFTTPVDGFGQANMMYKWQSFVGTHATRTCTGSNAVNAMSGTNKNAVFSMIMNYKDGAGARADNKREFPLGDTTDTAALDLFINLFGVGLKTGTLAI